MRLVESRAGVAASESHLPITHLMALALQGARVRESVTNELLLQRHRRGAPVTNLVAPQDPSARSDARRVKLVPRV